MSSSKNMHEFNDGKLWFHKKKNTLTLGITLNALDELGTVRAVELPNQGDDFDKDDVVCELDGANGSLKVYTPAAGFVIEINKAVVHDLEILNEDPADEGWLIKLEIQDESDLYE